MRQAITTKYLGPTNTRGSRIKASAESGSVTVPYAHSLSFEDNHRLAALMFANKWGWGSDWLGGALPDGIGYCFVDVSHLRGDK